MEIVGVKHFHSGEGITRMSKVRVSRGLGPPLFSLGLPFSSSRKCVRSRTSPHSTSGKFSVEPWSKRPLEAGEAPQGLRNGALERSRQTGWHQLTLVAPEAQRSTPRNRRCAFRTPFIPNSSWLSCLALLSWSQDFGRLICCPTSERGLRGASPKQEGT